MGILLSALPEKTVIDDSNDLFHIRSTATSIDYKISATNFVNDLIKNITRDAAFKTLSVGVASIPASVDILAGTEGVLRLANGGDTSNYSDIDDISNNELSIYKTNTTALATAIYIDTKGPSNQNESINFFRLSTTTSGTAKALFYSPGTSTAHAQIGTGTSDSFFQIGGGNFGIGLNNPSTPLQLNHTDSNLTAFRLGDANTISSDTGIYLRTSGVAYIGTNAANGKIRIMANTFGSSDNGITVDSGGKIGIGIGTTTPDCDAGGMTFHLGTGSVFTTAKNSNISHGITSIAETDTAAIIKIFSGISGGIDIVGLSETTRPFRLRSYANTAEISGDNALFELSAYKGTTPGALADNEQLLVIQNNGTAKIKALGSGSLRTSQESIAGLGEPISYADTSSTTYKKCAKMSSTLIAAVRVDTSTSAIDLQMYTYDAATQSLSSTGSPITVASITGSISAEHFSITALSSTVIAVSFVESGGGTLRQVKAYTWSGSSWSSTGSAYTIPGTYGPNALLAMSSSIVVLAYQSNSSATTLQALSWSGSAWSTTGTSVSPGISSAYFSLSYYNSSTFIICSIYLSNSSYAHAYTWDGSNFTIKARAFFTDDFSTYINSTVFDTNGNGVNAGGASFKYYDSRAVIAQLKLASGSGIITKIPGTMMFIDDYTIIADITYSKTAVGIEATRALAVIPLARELN